MNLSLPLETVVSTAVEQISTGVQLKLSQIEAQKERDFSQQMKELEFYKSNYEKEIRDIFNFWFDLIRITHIKDNISLSQEQRNKYNKEYLKLASVDNMAKYQMNTLKYGGKETARILALTKSVGRIELDEKNKNATIFTWTAILAVLKRDVLGQELDVLDILRVLLNDYDENEKSILAGKQFCVELYKKRYGENPCWK